MEFIPTNIPDVIVVEPDVFADERGFFMETWQDQKFREGGIDAHFVQDNHSKSCLGTLRGLHYQIQQAQGKLVRVTQGEVYDVAVDIRRSSATFGQYTGVILSAENKKMLWVPEGFAHGFLVMSERAEFSYKCTSQYAPEHERCIMWNDPDLAIEWPVTEGKPLLLSAKDVVGTPLSKAETYP